MENMSQSSPHWSDEVNIAVLRTDMHYMKDKLDSIDSKISSNYVTKDEFEPIKKVVYGLVGLILSGVVVALLALVVK